MKIIERNFSKIIFRLKIARSRKKKDKFYPFRFDTSIDSHEFYRGELQDTRIIFKVRNI